MINHLEFCHTERINSDTNHSIFKMVTDLPHIKVLNGTWFVHQLQDSIYLTRWKQPCCKSDNSYTQKDGSILIPDFKHLWKIWFTTTLPTPDPIHHLIKSLLPAFLIHTTLSQLFSCHSCRFLSSPSEQRPTVGHHWQVNGITPDASIHSVHVFFITQAGTKLEQSPRNIYTKTLFQ